MIDIAPQDAVLRPEVAGALSLARRHEESARRVWTAITRNGPYRRRRARSLAKRHREKALKLRRRAVVLNAKGEKSPTLHDVEMNYIQLVLLKHDGDKPAAAKELGINLKTLYNKINQHQHMKDQWLGTKGATA